MDLHVEKVQKPQATIDDDSAQDDSKVRSELSLDGSDHATVKEERIVLGQQGQERFGISDEEWEQDPDHPRNWRGNKRWTNALIISVTGFLRYAISRRTLAPSCIIIRCILTFGIFRHRCRSPHVTCMTIQYVRIFDTRSSSFHHPSSISSRVQGARHAHNSSLRFGTRRRTVLLCASI